MSSLAIETSDLVRSFRRRGDSPLIALSGVSLAVPRGELFGLLGPNGAGKTTLIKILVTLLLPSSGEAKVAGFDVATQPDEVRRRISMVSGGETSGFGMLTLTEQLWMFAQFHAMRTKDAKRRIDELLEAVGLGDQRRTRVSDLSTGMRQRLNLARGFLTDPQVLFLDEPTVGLDVAAARDVRAYVQHWMAERPGRTILLTTHYLAEAEELCDRVAIIDRGAILACDSPAGLRQGAAGGRRYTVRTGKEPADGWQSAVAGLRWASVDGTEVTAELAPDGDVPSLVAALAAAGGTVDHITETEPTLEDVFVDILGRDFPADEPEREPR